LRHRSSSPSTLLRLEGIIVAVISTVAYSKLHHHGWWPFVLLLLMPDLFMIGYLRGIKFGAICYNAGHTYVTPAILTVVILSTNSNQWLWVVTIWTAHIGLDRALGYGLKYPTRFQDTHLQRL
jgi:Domain of unknown function (DUF4260)